MKVNKKDLARLNSKLRRIKIGTEKDVNDVLKYFVLNSRNDIKKDAPVDTANLRRSVKGQTVTRTSGFVESLAFDENDFDYAPIQEFGSVFRPAKPYFYPNIRRNFKRALVMLRIKNKRTVKK
jgi:hypothetical protein